MNQRSSRSWIGQVVIFLVLSLLFSALPFLFALLLDKSSLGLAIFTAWYALFPPVILLVLAWLLYRGETSWLTFAGRLWVGLGLWFGVQTLLKALSGLHIVVLLFTLPAMLAGGKGFLVATIIFLVGGIALWVAGTRLDVPQPASANKTIFAVATGVLLALIVIGTPLLIVLTSRPVSAIPAGGPDIPTEDEVFGYVSDVYNLGIRRPGWPATEEAKDYLVDKLEEFGFGEVHIEPYEFEPFWKENTWSLTVNPDSDDAWQPDSYFVPYSGPTGADGVTAEVVDIGEGTDEDFAAADVAGKIILVDIPPTDIGWGQMKLFTYMAYDPDETAGEWTHPYPIGWLPKVDRIHELAEEHGAAGVIGVLQSYPEMGKFGYYAPYDGINRPVPGLYVLDKDGDKLRKQVEGGRVEAQLILDADVSKGTAWTVYGVLPGRSDQIIMVHTHYDAPWQSGIEDSSGVGMVLGLARYYAQLSKNERPYTMVFIFMGTHMIGAPSNHAFMEEHADDIMANLLIDVCIEHIADDYNPPNPPTGLVEPRGNFLSENPVVVSLYAGAVAEHGAYRTLLFPTGTPLGVPTDAGMFARSGYPVSSFISGPVWLFDDDDSLERVHKEQLGVLSSVYVDYIERLGRVGAPLLRFNLNVWTVVVAAIVLTPLATLSAAHWPRKSEAESEAKEE